MATVQQQAFRLAPQRYTISQLIQIARDAKYPFDLSKFTYDAARGRSDLLDLFPRLTASTAGVVPPLGDIAVPYRRSSAQRARGWSSESLDATSDVVSFSGNTAFPTSAEPKRQPSNPPMEPKTQKDVGFAKFLKKHSSPNHNRVTTGGRIVPMEKRGSPPKFDLNRPRVSAEIFHRGYKDEYDPSGSLLTTPASVDTDNLTSGGIKPVMSPDRDLLQQDVQAAMHSARDQANVIGAHMPSYGHQMQAHGFPVMGQFPPTPAYYYMPNPAYNSNVMYGAPAAWHGPISGPGLMPERDKFEGVEPTTQLLVTAQSCLAQAQAQYDLLDRQLKTMDRHRAMNSHDPSLATQRMAVVQQRADIKAMVNRLSVQVEMLQNCKSTGAESPSGFAASARPFVPQADLQRSPETLRPHSASDSVEFTAEADRGYVEKSPVPVPRSRKIIAIVPPPSKDTAQKKKSQAAVKTAERESVWEVDQWGVRYRDSSNKSVGTVLHQTEPTKPSIPKRPAGQPAIAPRKISKDIGAPPEVIEWNEGRPGPLPEELAGMTEVYYDALRLPVGVIAVFALANGDSFEVFGANLQPGDSSMGAWERSYWQEKPTFTRKILSDLRSKAQIVDGHLYDDEFLLGKPKQTPVSAFDVQDMLEEAIRVEADRRQKVASAPQVEPTQNIDENKMSSLDDLSNKGLSSVSIQDIHATVRLPPSFDGTTETGRRDAKSVLTATNKNRSPRVLHRSAPNGGAWYGPHCRRVDS